MLDQFKLVFFGNMSSGKTELATQFANLDTTVLDLDPAIPNGKLKNYGPTSGASYYYQDKKQGGANNWDIWDTSGDPKYDAVRALHFQRTYVAFLCVDLSNPIDPDSIAQQCRYFKETNPSITILVVGTKADLSPENAQILKNLQINIDENNVIDSNNIIITSAKTGAGVKQLVKRTEELCEYFKKHIPEHNKLEILRDAKNALLSQLEENDVPLEQCGLISSEIHTLLIHLKYDKPDAEERARAINAFLKNCEKILDYKYSDATKAVLIFAATIAVVFAVACLGFVIGFALGAWSGPGALLSGLVAGTTAAVAVASASSALAVGAGGLAAYSLFKRPSDMAAVDTYMEDIFQVYPNISGSSNE